MFAKHNGRFPAYSLFILTCGFSKFIFISMYYLHNMVSFLEILSYVHIKYFCLTLPCPQPPLSSPLTFFFNVPVKIFILRAATFSFVSTVHTWVSLCGPVNLYEWLWVPSSLQGCYLFRKPTGGLCHDKSLSEIIVGVREG